MDQPLFIRFQEKAKSLAAEVHYAADPEQAGMLAAQAVQQLGSPRVGLVTSPLIEECRIASQVEKAGGTIFQDRLPEHAGNLTVGISEMDLGIAENGSLVQDATDLVKRLVSMLPEAHIALIRGDNLVSGIDDALAYYFQDGHPPGYIAFVGGPSRTADIERELTIGVHGPGRLVIIVVDRPGGEKILEQKTI